MIWKGAPFSEAMRRPFVRRFRPSRKMIYRQLKMQPNTLKDESAAWRTRNRECTVRAVRQQTSTPWPVRHIFSEFRGPSWSRSTLLHERSGALADFLKRHFQTTKLLRAQLREHSFHLSRMLSEGRNNEVLAPRGEGNDPNTPVFRALDAGHQALREESVHGDTDRAWREIHDRAYRIDGQRPLV